MQITIFALALALVRALSRALAIVLALALHGRIHPLNGGPLSRSVRGIPGPPLENCPIVGAIFGDASPLHAGLAA